MRDEQAIETEATELLRTLIRNRCVNDGTAASGQETRSVSALEAYFNGAGVACERYTSQPGRESLIARIEGSDPKAPRLLLMGHTDVVPVSPEGWQRDPFGGELVDGVVWGRGAIDMLNLTTTMAVATRRLARDGFRPRGTLIYLAVADEEAGVKTSSSTPGMGIRSIMITTTTPTATRTSLRWVQRFPTTARASAMTGLPQRVQDAHTTASAPP